MNIKYITTGALAGLVLAGGVAGAVSAQSAVDATGLSEDQIIEIALSEIPGEVTEVEQERRRGQSIFEVEVTGEDGIEMELAIDAQTGEILKVEAEGEGCDDGDEDEDDTDEA